MRNLDSVLVTKNVPLTTRLTAREIWVSKDGEITLFVSQFGPDQPIPRFTVEYLESLCMDFYYGGHVHLNAIADIMLLNGVLPHSRYEKFYQALRYNAEHGNLTIIRSSLFL